MASLTKYVGTTGKVINTAAIRRRMADALDNAASQAKEQFAKTVESWDGKPDFTIKKDGEFARIVGTESEVYGYVDHGTKPHVIRPTGVGLLAFQPGHVAKTAVNVVGSAGGGAFGGFVYAREVKHPGTEARNFSENIAALAQNKITRVFDRVFQEAQR